MKELSILTTHFVGILNFEQKMAVLSLMRKEKYRDEIQLLAFADYGWGKNKNAGLVSNDVNHFGLIASY